MDSSFQPSASHGGRVFRGACVMLAVVAFAQGVAVAMAWKERPAVLGPAVEPVLIVPAAAVVVTREVDPFEPGSPALDDPHPELAGPAGEEPLETDPASPVLARPTIVGRAPLDVPITDEACLGHLDEGIYLRDRGDMVGAVRELRQALALAPEHPKLLYQLASALDGMSQEGKAAVLWRQLRLLGQDAGNYYQLAVGRFSEGGSLPVPDEAAAGAGDEKEGRFVVSEVKVERLPDTAQGEVWSISGRIERKQTEPAEVAQLGVKLHLFDEVNGQRIDRFVGEQPPHSWPDTPVDWVEGSERFQFVFNRPPFSPDELVKLGQRKYYGYALEIRYGTSEIFPENKLQDLAAEPAFLAEMSQEIPESAPAPEASPGGGNLDPSVPAGLPDQPDAVLFPGDRMDR